MWEVSLSEKDWHSNNFLWILTISLIFLACSGGDGGGVAPTPVPETKLLGTSEYDGAQGIAVDHNGNIHISGWTLGNLDGNINAGGADAFLTKYNSSGIKQWTRLVGGWIEG